MTDFSACYQAIVSTLREVHDGATRRLVNDAGHQLELSGVDGGVNARIHRPDAPASVWRALTELHLMAYPAKIMILALHNGDDGSSATGWVLDDAIGNDLLTFGPVTPGAAHPPTSRAAFDEALRAAGEGRVIELSEFTQRIIISHNVGSQGETGLHVERRLWNARANAYDVEHFTLTDISLDTSGRHAQVRVECTDDAGHPQVLELHLTAVTIAYHYAA